mmetsp:Transcript_16186/g.41260  ORF Transcript_16186/g.41260 Transcript_16186/m.41260 type:complete len:102 (+) Transcript_16186:301-606(+)
MLDEIDKDGSEVIEFEEFEKVMAQRVHMDCSEDDLMEAFQVFANKDDPEGTINRDALQELIHEFGTPSEHGHLLDCLDFGGEEGQTFFYKNFLSTMLASKE